MQQPFLVQIRSWFLLISAFLISMSLFAASQAQWSKLGGAYLLASKEMTVFQISKGAKDTVFKHLKFHVSGGEVKLIKAKVHMSDGHVLQLDIQKRIKPGLDTRAFKIADHNRSIKKVVLYYSSPNNHSADVSLLGAVKEIE